MSLAWYALRTAPVARCEFTVLHHVTQRELPAMVPYETKWVRKPNKRLADERKFPWFPAYVFVGLTCDQDYIDIRDSIAKRYGRPLVMGIVSFGGRYAKLTPQDVTFLSRLSSAVRPDIINPHKAFQVGGSVQIIDGPFSGNVAKVDSVSRKRVRVMLTMFNSAQVIDMPPSALEAA